MTRYRTIVADPPWHYDRTGYSFGEQHSQGGRHGRPRGTHLAYQTLTVEEIAALPVGRLAAQDAALFLWTTQRYLWKAPDIVRAWGFAPVKLLTWAKAPTGFSVGGVFGNASEFVLYGRRGRNVAINRISRDCVELAA